MKEKDRKDEAAGQGREEAVGAPGKGAAAPTVEHYLEGAEGITKGDDALQVVSFFLGDKEYAFEVTDAFEVLRPREITEVPRVPDFIRGILSVRGQMVPVMNLKLRLGVGTNGDGATGPRVLVAGDAENRAGFIVDRMGGVKEVGTGSVRPSSLKFAKWEIKDSGAAIQVLDIERLLDIKKV